MADDTPTGDDTDPDESDAEGDAYVCGSTDTGDGSPCQFPVQSPDGRCHMHPRDGSGPPDGHGEGTADRNALAANDAGPPEGSKNGLRHGLYAAERDPTGLFTWFREHDPAMAEQIRRWFWSYMDDAPFEAYNGDADRYSPPVMDVVDLDSLEGQQDVADDVDDLDTVTVSQGPPRQHAAADAPPVDVQTLTGKAHRLFVVCVHQAVLTQVTLEQAKQLLTKLQPTQTMDGGIVEVEDELPSNLPKSRMRKADLRELKTLGVLDDPESQKADAMSSWGEAAKKVAMRKDDQVQELDQPQTDADDHQGAQ